MKILIDNGHGKETPGKRSPDAVRGLTSSPLYFREYAWAREVAARVVNTLRFWGYDAELLVPEETDVPLSERARRVNAHCLALGKGEVLLASIHANAAGDGSRWLSARGWSVYTTKGVTEADKLADEIAKVAKEEFKAPLTLRLKADKYLERDQEENFTILAKTLCPAVLVENFFQDNRDDVRFLNSVQGKAACAYVTARGIDRYIQTYKR